MWPATSSFVLPLATETDGHSGARGCLVRTGSELDNRLVHKSRPHAAIVTSHRSVDLLGELRCRGAHISFRTAAVVPMPPKIANPLSVAARVVVRATPGEIHRVRLPGRDNDA